MKAGHELWADINILSISKDEDEAGFVDVETSKGIIRGKSQWIRHHGLYEDWHGNLVVYKSKTAMCLAYDQSEVEENIITETTDALWDFKIYLDIKPVSVNQMFYRNKKKTRIYEDFQLAFMPFIQGNFAPERVRNGEVGLELIADFGFATRASDLDNALKGTIDTLQSLLGFNDNIITKITCHKHIVGKGNEGIGIRLKEIDKIDKTINNDWRRKYK